MLFPKRQNKVAHACAFSVQPNYTRTAHACNYARNNGDVEDSWDSVSNILNFAGSDELGFAEVAGPGYWNDPDMVSLSQQWIGILEIR